MPPAELDPDLADRLAVRVGSAASQSPSLSCLVKVSTGSPAGVRTASTRVPGTMPITLCSTPRLSVSATMASRFLSESKIS